jgi:Cytochrome P460
LSPKFRTTLAALCLLTATIAFSIALHKPATAMAATTTTLSYDKNGQMLPPTNYREWIYLTTGIGMSYTPKMAGMEDQSSFDNVFVNPEAYRSFLETGTWPDKTIMVLEARNAQTKGSINQNGHFQSGSAQDLEVHVKDESRFPGKWAFFSFDPAGGNGKLFPQTAACYACHTAHAAVDTTFVQFYPTLLPIAQKKATLSPAFLKDEASTSPNK